MRANLDRLLGLLFSQKVLLALTQAGMSREEAYHLVQRHAMAVWNGDGAFLDRLRADPEVARHLDLASLEALFDLCDYLKHADTIFRRVFTEDEDPALSGPRRS
jgi:adenylosuccinate lyase